MAGVNLCDNKETNVAMNGNLDSKDGAIQQKQWQEMVHQKVVQSAYEIIRLKGYTR